MHRLLLCQSAVRSCLATSGGGVSVARQSRCRLIHSTAFLSKVVQFNLSDIGEGIAEVQVKEWFIKEGDTVGQFDDVCEVQSDKASVTITSRYDGVVKKVHFKVDDIARVGQPLLDMEVEGDDQPSSTSASSSEDSSQQRSEGSPPAREKIDTAPRPIKCDQQHSADDNAGRASGAKALAAPAVRRIASENDVKITDVRGTGKDGRVLKEDIVRFLEDRMGARPLDVAGIRSEPADRGESMPRPRFMHGADRTVPIRGYTRAMVKSMTMAVAIPHFTHCDEINVDRLVDLKAQLQAMAKEKGVRMSYMPLFIKAASLALHHYPILNSRVDERCENLTYIASHNISIAMDTPDGLVVPNVKHCEQKSLWDIARDLNRLQEAGAKLKLETADLADGTFTLSNIGTIGGTYAKPLIFLPQVAIGALGGIMLLPRYAPDGSLRPVHTVKVSWSADHRIVDGATMARFSAKWKSYLEQPALMIAEMN